MPTLDRMIGDTVAVLAHLKVRQADLFGHSLGGMIATGMAIRHPDVARNVTTLGAPYQLKGRGDADKAWMPRISQGGDVTTLGQPKGAWRA
jgi:pimeloyl-ACP methyl ester carboxylesterase